MLRRYEKGDIEKIKLQPEQERERNSNWKLFANEKTLVFADGDRVLAIIYPHEEYGRITLYALVGRDSGYKSVSIVRKMKAWIKEQLQRSDINRVEMNCQTMFVDANRLARILGFKLEGTLHKFFCGMNFNIWGIYK